MIYTPTHLHIESYYITATHSNSSQPWKYHRNISVRLEELKGQCCKNLDWINLLFRGFAELWYCAVK